MAESGRRCDPLHVVEGELQTSEDDTPEVNCGKGTAKAQR